jgi:hypothetical protein
LAAKTTDERLEELWGLTGRIPIGEEIRAPLAVYEHTVYCGTKAGHLWKISTDTLDRELAKEYPKALSRLYTVRQLVCGQGVILERKSIDDKKLSESEQQALASRLDGKTDTNNITLWAVDPDKSTIAFVRIHGRKAVMEIWSEDGNTRFQSIEITSPGYTRGSAGRLLPLGDGYLLSARELMWVPRDPETKLWDFGVGPRPKRSTLLTHFEHTTFFGVPLLYGNRLFIGCRDGGIYVFDVDRVAGQTGHSTSDQSVAIPTP